MHAGCRKQFQIIDSSVTDSADIGIWPFYTDLFWQLFLRFKCLPVLVRNDTAIKPLIRPIYLNVYVKMFLTFLNPDESDISK